MKPETPPLQSSFPPEEPDSSPPAELIPESAPGEAIVPHSTEGTPLTPTLSTDHTDTDDDGDERPEPPPDPQLYADAAIVFVHGMGEAHRGAMLQDYMNASLEWVKRTVTNDFTSLRLEDLDESLSSGVNYLERLRADPEDQSAPYKHKDWLDISYVNDSLLRSVDSTPAVFQPPYMRLQMHSHPTDGEDSPRLKKSVVAVEAWWDGEFDPPPFSDVAMWALGVAPALILRHLALLWESNPSRDADTLEIHEKPPESGSKFRYLVALLGTLVGGFVGLLAQWFICILLAFGRVPVLQKYVKAIVLKLTTSFGDVLTYVHNGVQSAAVRSTVIRTFDWLHARYNVDHLVVISHSLGSIIAYDVLSSRDLLRPKSADPATSPTPPASGANNATFITFGSPIKKVNLLLELKRDDQRISLGMLFATFSTLCAIIAVIAMAMAEPWWSGTSAQWTYAVAVTIVASGLLFGVGAHSRPVEFAGFHLSIAQLAAVAIAVVGTITGLVAQGIQQGFAGMAFILPTILAGAVLVFLLRTIRQISNSRQNFAYDPARMSQSLAPLLALLALLVLATVYQLVPPIAFLFLMALLLSLMSGSNPLEEFRQEPAQKYSRAKPVLKFRTAITRWIDFWAGSDLVSEYGLHDIHYRTDQDLNTAKESLPNPISRRITNQKSLIGDHTSYRANQEQFIAPLTHRLMRLLGFVDEPADETHVRLMDSVIRSRAKRVGYLSWIGLLLMAAFLLLSPGIFRSVGEFIVFDLPSASEIAAGSDASASEAVSIPPENDVDDGSLPGWFSSFYNEKPLTCAGLNCHIRELPLVPKDFSISVMENPIFSEVVVYGLGYAVGLILVSIVRVTLLATPWKYWESALIESILQSDGRKSFNYRVRMGVFFGAAAAVVVFALVVNSHILADPIGFGWIVEHELAPRQTVVRFLKWIVSPFDDQVTTVARSLGTIFSLEEPIARPDGG